MRFSDPQWLPAGLAAAAVVIFLWYRHDKRQHAALAKFVAADLRPRLTRSVSVAARRTRRGLFLGALLALFIALAGPLLGYRWEQVSRRGNDIIFAIDTSRSMLTPDVKPNRLARAKLAIDDFVNQLDGDAVGIVAFAGSAYLVCPITLDYGAFHESLGAVDTNIIPHGGTDISSAITAAADALRRRPGSDKILVLVTDGEDLEGSAVDTARAAAQSGVKIYTVGVGTAAGDLIPIPADQGGGLVKDENGAFVRSRLDESALKAIAADAGGIYAPLGTQGEGLQAIFNSVFSTAAKHDLASRQQKIYIERYQWPLAASFGMLLASLLIGTRRRSTVRRAASRPVTATSAAVLAGLLCVGLGPRAATAAADTAVTPDSKKPVLEYNQGTSAYRAGQFPQAAKAFQDAISHAPANGVKRLADQEDAYYNLGNTLYRSGQATLPSSPQETIQQWTDAVKAYDTALQLKADDADSKYNRDLVKRKLDALQKQQQKQGGGQGQPPPGQGGGSGQPPPGQGGQPGQPPPGQNGQPGQPPPGQNGQPGQPPPGQGGQPGQPPPGQNGQPGQPPPGQGAQQPPPAAQGGQSGQQPPGQQPQPGQPSPPKAGSNGAQSPAAGGGQPQAADGEPQHGSGDEGGGETRVAGQMSREEARELLDSEKADEHHRLGVPVARRDPNDPPEKPFKNW